MKNFVTIRKVHITTLILCAMVVLSLPIGLQCAQHLEGGPPASLYLHHNGVELGRNKPR